MKQEGEELSNSGIREGERDYQLPYSGLGMEAGYL